MAKKKAMKATKAMKAAKATKMAGAGEMLKERWSSTLDALASAEHEVEKQVKSLMKKNKLSAKDAEALLKSLGRQLGSQRKKAVKELESRLKTLQGRVKKERKAAGRVVDDAVQRALAAFNIPSRSEVSDLTHKVEELSRKIDALKRQSGRRAA